MTDGLDLLRALLQETRDAQLKGNSILADLRVDVAALHRSQDAQGAAIADMRVEVRAMGERLREAELRMERLPRAEDLDDLERRHEQLEGRVRTLEGDGRETRGATKVIGGGLREVWRYLVAAVIGAVVAAVAWTMKHGASPTG